MRGKRAGTRVRGGSSWREVQEVSGEVHRGAAVRGLLKISPPHHRGKSETTARSTRRGAGARGPGTRRLGSAGVAPRCPVPTAADFGDKGRSRTDGGALRRGVGEQPALKMQAASGG